jgi:hypothetical protein
VTHEHRRQLLHEAREQAAALVLIVASLVSATTAIAGRNLWVAVVAGITTLLSGAQVLRAQVLVPVRVKAAQRAAVPVGPKDLSFPILGTAVQYKPGRRRHQGARHQHHQPRLVPPDGPDSADTRRPSTRPHTTRGRNVRPKRENRPR